VLVAVHGAVIRGQREHRIRRLEETRAGAVDVQETELRRIERDLHDGAQARIVALGMSLGRAEQALDTDPEAVRELLAEARQGAGEALAELRDLARGIRPPILTDRGLEPAISALTAHTPLPVSLAVDLVLERYDAAVETAAYFTVAEALANAIKHAHAHHVDVRIKRADPVIRTIYAKSYRLANRIFFGLRVTDVDCACKPKARCCRSPCATPPAARSA